ncbi:CHAD domain-containing protein [Nocardia veterana]|uniref:CHAD domain-containing protein n=1 Tax=Nocardia veterana TaxID=132249 RepID=A0A7X6M0Z4_9NOCA|nr:CHAD domain-containing protein [Nocardia veterana]NKY88284.1 CHAD domain-containing protein [Nocardia veterana]
MSAAAGPAVVAALGEDVDRLLSAEPKVRADEPDSVHQMRVATRRLRSVLRSYRKVFQRKDIDAIRDELRWLAGLLGVARDAEVRADRFAALLAEYPDIQRRLGRRLVSSERAAYTDAHRAVLHALDGERYTSLRTRLLGLRTDPPLRRKRAARDAEQVFTAAVRADLRRLQRRVRAEREVDDADCVEALHDIRKAAKRLRYSAEAATDVLDGPAEDLARHAKKVQSVLGDHRDAIEALATITARAEAVRTRGADTGPYELLCAAEAEAARTALDQYPALVEFLRYDYLS